MAAFPTGVTIVTTLDDDGAACGLTCNAFLSVSTKPPLVLVSISRSSKTLPALQKTGRFVVNFIKAGRQELAARCAGKSDDKFSDIVWRGTGHYGLPVLTEDSVAHVACDTVRELVVGDHVLIIGEVHDARPLEADAVPLLYFRREYDHWPATASSDAAD